jgi:hypothetical protein
VVSSYQWRAGCAADLFAAEKRAWGLRSYGFNSLLVGGTELALVSVVFLLKAKWCDAGLFFLLLFELGCPLAA